MSVSSLAKGKAKAILLAGLIGGTINGVRTGGKYANDARNTVDTTREFQEFKKQHELVIERLKKDRVGIGQVSWGPGNKIPVTYPINEIRILIAAGRGGGIHANLTDIIENPSHYPVMYETNRKWDRLTPETVSAVKKLMKMEPKVHNELEKIRKIEKKARIAGLKKGALRGSLIGSGVAAGLIGAAAMKRKWNQRRRR
ncbi:MAG: hypothetical protein NTY48_05620 [Candidatus Diapherotrites archaeon]|nr:hypothetical protein [Candidatus Diapherotrites archaeon]